MESTETIERFLAKHKKTIKLLNVGRSYKEIQAITGTAPATVSKLRKALGNRQSINYIQ